MKVMRLFAYLCAVCVLTSLILFTQSGCEEARGLSGLQVDPPMATLGTNDSSVVLSVVGGITNSTLALPLAWEVSDPNLGQITASSGATAVYRRSSANGVNTVTVRDQFSNEGFATITQRDASYSFNLVADPSTVSVNQGTTIRIEGAEAQAPFSWRLASGPGSLSADSGGRSAAYSAGPNTGVAQITVTDGNGVSASIAITVETSNGDGPPSNGPGGPGSP